jgi:hypothetical protein
MLARLESAKWVKRTLMIQIAVSFISTRPSPAKSP